MAKAAPTLPFDFRTDAHARDPFPVYSLLRDAYPLCRLADGVYVVSRYHDVRRVLSVHASFRARVHQEPVFNYQWLADRYPRNEFLQGYDPPEHDKYRAILGRHAIQDHLVAALPVIRAQARQLAAEIPPGEVYDFVANFAFPLAATAVAAMTGIPLVTPEAIARAREWAELVEALTEDPAPTTKERVESLLQAQTSAFVSLLADRRARPRRDLASHLVQATMDGQPLSEPDLHGALNLLLITGLTPALQFPIAMVVLAEQPRLLAELRRHGRWSGFVEELIRHSSTGQSAIRVATEAVQLHGFEIPAGARVRALVAAANRDPDVFDEPDDFRLARPNIGAHLGFGAGVHHCIGATVTRQVLRIGLGEIFKRFANLEIPPAHEQDWYYAVAARSLRTLPVRFSP